MDDGIGVWIVADTDARIQPDALDGRLRVIGMYKTALRALEVVRSKRVVNTAEAKWDRAVKR